jgi:cell division protein FtsB
MIFFKKIAYKLKQLFPRFKTWSFNWGSIFWSLFFTFLIIVLSMNIYNAYTKGVDTINSFQQDQQKLEDLKAENQQLQTQVQEYESIEYKKMYARDNLDLADKDETLYYVNRPQPTPQIEGLPQPTMSVSLSNNLAVWGKLILGL